MWRYQTPRSEFWIAVMMIYISTSLFSRYFTFEFQIWKPLTRARKQGVDTLFVLMNVITL